MGPIDHFLSHLDKFERGSAVALDAAGEDRLVRDFVSLCAPVIGASASVDLCRNILDRLRREIPSQLRKLGFTAAFLLGEFDDTMSPCRSLFDKKDSVGAIAPGIMSLDQDAGEDIREILEDVSGEMNLETLTALMEELLSREGLPEISSEGRKKKLRPFFYPLFYDMFTRRQLTRKELHYAGSD